MSEQLKYELPHRVLFPKGKQRRLLESARRSLKPSTWSNFAALCRVQQRTLYDWRREKYAMSASALATIQKKLRFVPKSFKLVHPYQHLRLAGRLGALRRYQRYGNPGTPDGRRKGGETTQRFFRSHPEHAHRVGFVLRKPVLRPQYSDQLAEFVGIMLGDGHVGQYQAMLYSNSKTERDFARHAQKLFSDLFGVSSTLQWQKKNCVAVVASGKNLVNALHALGLPSGDKIQQKSSVPQWIFGKPRFMKACLRGLFDTDGTVFRHIHTVEGRPYRHMGIGFTSYSPVLLRDVDRILKSLKFRSRFYPQRGHIFLYRLGEVQRYMHEIGTHNSHHRKRFLAFKDLRRGRVVAERTRLESV